MTGDHSVTSAAFNSVFFLRKVPTATLFCVELLPCGDDSRLPGTLRRVAPLSTPPQKIFPMSQSCSFSPRTFFPAARMESALLIYFFSIPLLGRDSSFRCALPVSVGPPYFGYRAVTFMGLPPTEVF